MEDNLHISITAKLVKSGNHHSTEQNMILTKQ